MVETLSEVAVERSTYVVTISFYDEDDNPVVPSSVTWTLTDEDGVVINDREDVVATPATSLEMVLSGLDLAVSGQVTATRILTVSGVYDSDAGSDLPLRAHVRFSVEGLVSE